MNIAGKKVVIVSHYYPPHVGGLENVVRHQAASFVKAGCRVSVITCSHSKSFLGISNEAGVAVYRQRALNFFEDRFGIPFPIGGYGLFSCLWRQISDADVIHIHDIFYETSWLAYVFARLMKKPVFLTQHVGIVSHSSRTVMIIQKAVYAVWGRAIFNYCQAIVVYNGNVKNFLIDREVDEKKVFEFRNGVDLSRFRPASLVEKNEIRLRFGLPLGKPLVLFVGRFVPKKGLDLLLKAFSPEYDIIFAGSGSVPEKWRTVLGAHFVGALSQAELAKMYRATDIFVLMAQGELFTLAMQEAMASGLPVITANDPGYEEYDIDPSMVAFVRPDAVELKNRIKKIISDEELRNKMILYSINYAKAKFDRENNIKNLLNLYLSFKPKNDATEKGSCENGKEPAKNDLTLSVVVLTFNSERTIAACLESLVAQTVKDFNVIIVDDDSTDNTLATVDSFRASGRLNIEVLRNGTHNISNGRNIGLAAAESDLVAFLDSDDCASPDWIESASRSFNHDPQIAVLGSQRTNFGHSLLAKAISANDDIILKLFNKQKIQFGAGGSVFNKKILGDDYLFDKNFVYAEDLEIFQRIAQKNKIFYDTEAKIWVLSRETAMSYFKQMYNYGLWKIYYCFSAKSFRFIDFVPLLIVAGSVVCGLVLRSWIPLLSLGIFSFLEFLFIVGAMRPKMEVLLFSFPAFLIKNSAWCLGTAMGLINLSIDKKLRMVFFGKKLEIYE